MTKKEALRLFEEKKVRTVWDDVEEKWYFSIVDVCGILTDQPDYEHARNYWKVLKHRLVKEGNETVTNCNQLKLRANLLNNGWHRWPASASTRCKIPKRV